MRVTATTDDKVLQYQKARNLGDVSRYAVGLQLRLKSGERVYVALSALELVLYFENDVAVHYDLAGRVAKVAQPDYYRRRGLSHQVLSTRIRTTAEGGGIERQMLSPDEADELVAEAQGRSASVLAELGEGSVMLEYSKLSPAEALKQILPQLEKAARFGTKEAHADAEKFHSIYGRVAVLPPDQYNSLVLQATEGCAYSCCLFCELYRGVFYDRKSPVEFARHLQQAIAYHGETLRTRRSIFLGEANALALPHSDLVKIFGVLRDHFEFPANHDRPVPANWWLGHPTRFDGVSTFLDAFTGPRRTRDEFVELRDLGLRRVYLGLETGDDQLLAWLCKPATRAGITQTVRTLKEAGLTVGVIALLGAGGHEFAEAHARQTASLINELPLGREDFIYFSPLVIYPNSRYAEQTSALKMERLSTAQMQDQERAIRDALHFDEQRGRPHIARYELESFVY